MQQSLKSYCVNKISNTKSLILGRLSLRYPFPGVLPDGGWKRRKTTAVLTCIPDLGPDQTPTDAFNLGLLLFSPSVHGGKPWPPPRSAAFLELRGSARVTFGGRIFQMQISPLDREWNLLPLMKGTSGESSAPRPARAECQTQLLGGEKSLPPPPIRLPPPWSQRSWANTCELIVITTAVRRRPNFPQPQLETAR